MPAGSPISRARSALPTFTMDALAAAWGSAIQPVTVTTGSSPCQLYAPVTFQTASRASVSSGMLRPSCCTGRRRRVSAGVAACAVPARRERRTAATTLAPPEPASRASSAARSRDCPTRVKSTTIIPSTIVM